MDGTILIADDDRTIRTVLTQAFTRAGCKVHATSSLLTLMRWVQEDMGDLVITDVMMPDGSGLEMLPEISKLRHDLPVIVISAQNTIMTTIKAAEAKAFDYLPKPFDLPDLMKRAARALEISRQGRRPRKPPVNSGNELPLVGRTPVMQNLYSLIAKIVHSNLAILISGESGTGKSLIARTIHDFSERRNLPFVVAPVSDLVDVDSVESMLARAGDGTIVFDTVDDLAVDIQGIISQKIDQLNGQGPRIMATTQTGLADKAQNSTFREDLFYRLNGVGLDVPPLRDRIDDITLLSDFFLAKNTQTMVKTISADAEKLMRRYSWPGNVRQLQNCLNRLQITSPEPQISTADVQLAIGGQPMTEPAEQYGVQDKLSASILRHLQRYFDLHGGVLPPPGLYGRILHEMELPLLEIAMLETGGNQAKCAALLGINRNTLRKKLTELDIRVTRRRKMM